MRSSPSRPTGPGYFWAKWLKASPGTRDGDHLTPDDAWSVVEVFGNGDESHPDHLMVFVPGVETPQVIADFAWGARPLPEPLA